MFPYIVKKMFVLPILLWYAHEETKHSGRPCWW